TPGKKWVCRKARLIASCREASKAAADSSRLCDPSTRHSLAFPGCFRQFNRIESFEGCWCGVSLFTSAQFALDHLADCLAIDTHVGGLKTCHDVLHDSAHLFHSGRAHLNYYRSNPSLDLRFSGSLGHIGFN